MKVSTVRVVIGISDDKRPETFMSSATYKTSDSYECWWGRSASAMANRKYSAGFKAQQMCEDTSIA